MNDTVLINVRIPLETKIAWKRVLQQERSTATAIINQWILEHIRQHEQDSHKLESLNQPVRFFSSSLDHQDYDSGW